jgi:serine/threonine protein kinase
LEDALPRIGTTLGNFEIHTLLGCRGMGEVFREKDRKLGWDLAIKVLPEEFAKDADRVARFRREPRAAFAINHPNIFTMHDIDEAEGHGFLAMELVEGRALKQRILGCCFRRKKLSTLGFRLQTSPNLPPQEAGEKCESRP